MGKIWANLEFFGSEKELFWPKKNYGQKIIKKELLIAKKSFELR